MATTFYTGATSVEIGGICDDLFSGVVGAFEQNFADSKEIGASFAASVEGEMVVDVWGGHRDLDRSQPWHEDTIVCVLLHNKDDDVSMRVDARRSWGAGLRSTRRALLAGI